MAVEIRTGADVGDLRAGLEPISHYFGRTPDEERAERLGRSLEPGRFHVAWEDGRAVGATAAYSFRLTVPGARLPAAGVLAVGVLPTHRRRGILTALTRAQLDDVRERGEPLAYLWASEDVIYGRYGYGAATRSGRIEIPLDHADFHPFERVGTLRLVGLEEALVLMPPIHERLAVETVGMFSRTREWWEARTLADLPAHRQGGGEQWRVVHEVDGKPEGYALYRTHFQMDGGVPTGFVNVGESLGTTMRSTRELWRYLLDIDWMASLKAYLLPLDHPLFHLLREPRRLDFRIHDASWVRLVDVEAALAARSYAGDGEVVLELRDGFCPWNDGRWRVSAGGCERVEAAAEIRLGAVELASVYLGGFGFGELARAGRVEEVAPGAIGRADVLFRTDRAPWCPEIF